LEEKNKARFFWGLSQQRVCASLCCFLLTSTFLLSSWSLAMAQENTIYQFTMQTIGGQEKSLSDYQGKVLLIVNTASKCGFTPQYGDLQKLYEKYQSQGLEILAFPANNFMGQEPGTDQEIKEFCDLRFKVKFPLFSKISVKGKDINPLFAYLTSQPGMEGGVSWNFNKFLVDPKGKLIARYGSRTKPQDQAVIEVLEQALRTI